MVITNRLLLGTIGWLPERGTYGVSLCILPKVSKKRPKFSLVISYGFLEIAWLGWRRWPYMSFQKDDRG